MQLHIQTIYVVVGLVSVISTTAMAALWRINSRMPGVVWWFCSSLCSSLAFGLLAFSAVRPLALPADFVSASNDVLDLTALLLMLEGTLRFRKSVSPTRWAWLAALVLIFALLAIVTQGHTIQRYLVHDLVAFAILLSVAGLFVWQTSRHEVLVHGMAAFFLLMIAAALVTRWILAVGATSDAGLAQHPFNMVVLLATVAFTMGWTYTVSIACYYRSQNTILRFARQDALTHLPNRRDVDETLQRAIGQSSRTGAGFGWVMLDLNGFKPVNDQHGHVVGDALLVELANRLKKFCRESDFAGRMGGDEFVVLIHGAENADQLHGAVKRLARTINGPVTLGGVALNIDASIGAALWPQDGRSARKLTAAADRRMYANKRRRGKSRGGIAAPMTPPPMRSA